MRKYLLSVAFLLALGFQVQACDICGCGGGNFYMGLLPNFKNKFIGIRYQYMQYHTQLISDPSQFSHNDYHTIELWSGWNIGKRWQVLAFVPYHINKQQDDEGISYKTGLGDISLMGNFQLFHKGRPMGREVEQELWVGAGLKLPTGNFNVDTRDPNLTIADINAQIGTGSVDFLLNALYHIRFNRFGIHTVANYKIGTANHSDYKYGDKFTASSIGYYRIKMGTIEIAPNLGMAYEYTASNQLSRQKIDLTGGYALTALAGLELNLNRVAIGFNLQKPVSQDFAAGQTSLQIRGMAHMTLVF